jgi:hypothetical protein
LLVKFFRRIWCLLTWIFSPVYLWIGLVILGASFVTILFGSETVIRFTGEVLQFVGIVFATWGLYSVWGYFEQPGIWTLAKVWWERRPRWKKVYRSKGKGLQVCVTGGTGTFQIWTNDDVTLPVDERIARIVRNVDRLRAELVSLEKRHIGLGDELEKARREDAERAKKIVDNQKNEAKKLHVGGIGMSMLGLEFIAIGVVLATIPAELAGLF